MPDKIVEYEFPLKVLYVDDDPDDKEFFTEALEKLPLKYTLFMARDYHEMMEILDREKGFDLIFLDINMPGKDGIECLKEIKTNKIYRNIPVVIFSTNQYEKTINNAFENGAHLHVVKPYAHINFVAALANVFSINWRNEPPVPPRARFVIDHTFTIDPSLHSGEKSTHA
jgi:CheY-like chemotaxis protein